MELREWGLSGLGQKVRLDPGDPEVVKLTNVYLSGEEYEILATSRLLRSARPAGMRAGREPSWQSTSSRVGSAVELQVDDLEAAGARAIDLGGTEAPWQPPDRNRDRIRIVLDPAGHPDCLFLRDE